MRSPSAMRSSGAGGTVVVGSGSCVLPRERPPDLRRSDVLAASAVWGSASGSATAAGMTSGSGVGSASGGATGSAFLRPRWIRDLRRSMTDRGALSGFSVESDALVLDERFLVDASGSAGGAVSGGAVG
jgi:hypothetical protein